MKQAPVFRSGADVIEVARRSGKARSATVNKLESQMRNAGDGAPRDYENAVKAQ